MENFDTITINVVWLTDLINHYMPILDEVCIASWQVNNPKYKIILWTNDERLKLNLLSKDTTEIKIIQNDLMSFVENITFETKDTMKLAHQADIIRYSILEQCGGITLDADVFCISPLEDLINRMNKENKSIVFGYEDNCRIGIALMSNLNNDGKQFYCDILSHYSTHYVKTSWLYNSIKYPMLLKNRYKDKILELPAGENWHYPNGLGDECSNLSNITPLFELEMPENFRGYGIHLYSNPKKWREYKLYLETNLYIKGPNDFWLLKNMNVIIDKYIDLMCKSNYRELSVNPITMEPF